METNSDVRLLRIYISNTDKFRHTSLSEAIVFAARRYGLSGATVLKGIMGYGSSRIIQSIKFWEITEKIPIVIEIVDNADKIEKFTQIILPWFDKLKYGCMITSEKVEVVLYKKGNPKRMFEN
jgi:PII-like signaling protein